MLQTILLALYTLIALLFLDNTFREGQIDGHRWDAMRVLGLMLCLVWPALLMHVAIVAYRDRQAS